MDNNTQSSDQIVENFKQKLVEEFKSQGIHTIGDLRKVINERKSQKDTVVSDNTNNFSYHTGLNNDLRNNQNISDPFPAGKSSKPLSFIEVMKRK